MKTKILVLGGAGYIGSVLVPDLLKQDYEVTVLDNLLYNQTSLLDCCAYKNFNFINGDICDYNLTNSLIKKSDTIILLAAIVGAPACKKNPTLTNLVNYEAPLNIIKNISTSQNVFFPTTNSGYGIGEKNHIVILMIILNHIYHIWIKKMDH